MKTIGCNLTKACQIFATFTKSFYKNMDTSLKFQEISPVYRGIIRSSISLVYVRCIEFDSILP